MKRFLISLLLLCPLSAGAIAVSWDRPTVGRVNPIFILDTVFGNIFTATSTTQASTFPYASTTALSSSNLSSGNCLQAGTGGLLTTIGSPCGTLSSYDAWLHLTNFGVLYSATTAPIWFQNDVAASTTVRFGNGIKTFLWNSAHGIAGIGTSSPYATFSVQGAAGISSASPASTTLAVKGGQGHSANADFTPAGKGGSNVIEGGTGGTNSAMFGIGGSGGDLNIVQGRAGSPTSSAQPGVVNIIEPGSGNTTIVSTQKTGEFSIITASGSTTMGGASAVPASVHPLDIGFIDAGTTAVGGGLGLVNNSGANGSFSGVSISTLASTGFSQFIGAVKTGASGLADIIFLNHSAQDGQPVSASDEKMRITSAGNVGIATTSPGTILSIGNTGANTINVSATATSTFGSGINARTGCFAIGGVCIGGGGAATTSFAATFPITLTTSPSSINFGFTGLATTSPWTNGQLAMVQSGNQVSSVATGTVSGTNGITATASRFVIGGALTIDCTVATASAAGCISANSFNTFTNKIATSAVPIIGNLAMWTGAFPATVGNVATGTLSATGPITVTAGNSVIGPGATIALTTPLTEAQGGTNATSIGAHMLLANNANTIVSTSTPTMAGFFATSSTATSTMAGAFLIGTTTQDTNTMLTISNFLNAMGGILIHTWTNITNALTIKNSTNLTVFNIDTTNSTGALFGVGTTTPWASVSIHANAGDTNTTLFAIASSTASATTTLFSIDNRGNIITKGAVPVLGACGTATISATSTDLRGSIVITAGTPTACTITFSSAKSDTPTCLVNDNSTTLSVGVGNASSTGVQFLMAAAFSGRLNYICMQ